MSTKPGQPNSVEPFVEDEIDAYHSPEPWTQDGRYIRDASGAIVVRGRTLADARRIVAAINATRDMPTEALESWLIQDVSDPNMRPDLEVALGEDPLASPYRVRPPDPGPAAPAVAPAPPPVSAPAAAPVRAERGVEEDSTARPPSGSTAARSNAGPPSAGSPPPSSILTPSCSTAG